MEATANGTAPPAAPITPELGLELSEEALLAQLRELIAQEQVNRLEAERQVDESRKRERRYERALVALEGPKPKIKSPKSSGAGAQRSDGSWNVSAQKVEEVFRRFVELREQQPELDLSAGRDLFRGHGWSPPPE
jgi:hypothetical protein